MPKGHRSTGTAGLQARITRRESGERDGVSADGRKSSSPVCYAAEGDVAYMGYATDEEIAAFLQELKNAEQRMADKIRDMLPKIRDDALHAELKAMLASHEENIETTNMALQQR